MVDYKSIRDGFREHAPDQRRAKGRSLFARRAEPLTLHQTISRFSYYSLGIAGLWALAFVLFLLSGADPKSKLHGGIFHFDYPPGGSVHDRVHVGHRN